MIKKAAVLAAVIGLTAVFYGCSRDDLSASGSDETAADAAAAYYTEDFSYVLYDADGAQAAEITGVQKEHKTEYSVPTEIDGIPVTAIGNNAFIYAPVVGLILPDTLAVIGNGAFYNCAALTSVKIPGSVSVIDDYAFYFCTMLRDVVIPKNCTEIGGLAFYGTPWFESLHAEFEIHGDGNLIDYNGAGGKVIIPSGVKRISSAFYGSTAVTSVILPDSVIKIGSAAFDGCTSLVSAEIPESVTDIGDSAFFGCTALKSLIIPPKVTHIGIHAFDGCDVLTLFCYAGSYAEEYAESNGIGCRIISESGNQ